MLTDEIDSHCRVLHDPVKPLADHGIVQARHAATKQHRNESLKRRLSATINTTAESDSRA